ncbi:hypothetical protein CC80DRAFT_566867 [Byssothecium circinans]|uniref:Uncharacterized protein n=1 Tax=Byssothecium circinans TaxID=147558 RepID=A0A6A5TPL1_9PLEO|nr:hypothetical protein CC80DRAFT_566867 [Byssothecium circinans]
MSGGSGALRKRTRIDLEDTDSELSDVPPSPMRQPKKRNTRQASNRISNAQKGTGTSNAHLSRPLTVSGPTPMATTALQSVAIVGAHTPSRPNPVQYPQAAALWDVITMNGTLGFVPRVLPTNSASSLNARQLQLVQNYVYNRRSYPECVADYNNAGGSVGGENITPKQKQTAISALIHVFSRVNSTWFSERDLARPMRAWPRPIQRAFRNVGLTEDYLPVNVPPAPGQPAAPAITLKSKAVAKARAAAIAKSVKDILDGTTVATPTQPGPSNHQTVAAQIALPNAETQGTANYDQYIVSSGDILSDGTVEVVEGSKQSDSTRAAVTGNTVTLHTPGSRQSSSSSLLSSSMSNQPPSSPSHADSSPAPTMLSGKDYFRLALVATWKSIHSEKEAEVLAAAYKKGFPEDPSHEDVRLIAMARAGDLWNEQLGRICYHGTYPTPMARLPQFDFEVPKIVDRVGLLRDEEVAVTPIIWDKTMRWQLRHFAHAAGFTHICDRVADDLRQCFEDKLEHDQALGNGVTTTGAYQHVLPEDIKGLFHQLASAEDWHMMMFVLDVIIEDHPNPWDIEDGYPGWLRDQFDLIPEGISTFHDYDWYVTKLDLEPGEFVTTCNCSSHNTCSAYHTHGDNECYEHLASMAKDELLVCELIDILSDQCENLSEDLRGELRDIFERDKEYVMQRIRQ